MHIQILFAVFLMFSVSCGDNIKVVDSSPGVGYPPDYPIGGNTPDEPGGTWHVTTPDAAPEMCEVLPWLTEDQCPDTFWQCKKLAVKRCWELCP